jgi:putative ABC transport system substrate-binding protein
MDRRRFLLTSLAGGFAAPLIAGAQSGDMYRVGFLSFGAPHSAHWETFLQALREHGLVEGRTIVFERRFSEGVAARVEAFARELVRLKVDAILATGAAMAGVRVVLEESSTIPVVLIAAGAYQIDELIRSWRQPHGRVTGFALMQEDLSGKRLELLKQLAPKVSRPALLAGHPQWPAFKTAGKTLGVDPIHGFVNSPDGLAEAFATITRERADGLCVPETGLNWSQRERIVKFAADQRLPAVYGWREFTDAGGLMSYGADIATHYRGAAEYLDRLRKGARPANLPVEQPLKYELVLNSKTAKALGLTIPPSLLARADQVLE